MQNKDSRINILVIEHINKKEIRFLIEIGYRTILKPNKGNKQLKCKNINLIYYYEFGKFSKRETHRKRKFSKTRKLLKIATFQL